VKALRSYPFSDIVSLLKKYFDGSVLHIRHSYQLGPLDVVSEVFLTSLIRL
jgi:hypothetical protein